jgi:hypothetical protein
VIRTRDGSQQLAKSTMHFPSCHLPEGRRPSSFFPFPARRMPNPNDLRHLHVRSGGPSNKSLDVVEPGSRFEIEGLR